MKNKPMLIALTLALVGVGLILNSYMSKDSKSDSKKVIENPTITNVRKKIRTKKYSDAKLVQVPMSSKERQQLLDGKKRKKQSGQSSQNGSDQDSLESVKDLVKDKVAKNKENQDVDNTGMPDSEDTSSAGSPIGIDDTLPEDQTADNQGSDSANDNSVSDSIVTQEDDIVVQTDGRQLLIERNFSGEILNCTGQTSWDSHHLYHPIPSRSNISIICETTSGFVVVDTSLDNL